MTSESRSDQGEVSEDRIPPWWMAWEIFAPRWAMAAEGLYDLPADAFDKFQCARFDTSRLREWVPTPKQGRRIILASQLVKLALNEPLANLPTRKCHLAEQLAGDGVWADLRLLAEAYLDGKHRLAEGKNLTRSPSARPLAKYLFPNQIRKLESRQLLADLINRASLMKAQTPLELFFEHATELTLYLDEAWFVGQNSAVNPNEGVIAGLICHGTPGELITGLPRLHNHSYLTPLQVPKALERLWQCPGCLPLIFHLRLPTNTVANPYYDLLLQQTIRFVLGWLLPRPRQSVRLHICPEAIAPTHAEGDTATDFYQGLLSGDACGRFANWGLAQVSWRTKQPPAESRWV